MELVGYSLCNFRHSFVTSSLLGPNVSLSTSFSRVLNTCYSPGARDQVSERVKLLRPPPPAGSRFNGGMKCSELNGNEHSPNLI
jgi:hypothetical protein